MELKPITLPYDKASLAPIISEQTMNFHFEKHYKGYVENCNKLKKDTDFENKTLDEIIINSDGGLFNNAAQVKNHEMFFTSLSPNPKELTNKELIAKIEKKFGSFEKMIEELSVKSTTLFGAGWAWLVINKENELEVVQGSNAYCPITLGFYPLLCVDIWEHAYYLDYQNRRADFVKEIWKIVDWSIVEYRFSLK